MSKEDNEYIKFSTKFKTVWFSVWLLSVSAFIVIPQISGANYFLFSSVLISALFILSSFFITFILSLILDLE